MKKPLIGVTPLLDTELDSLWMLPGYFRLVEQAGGVPVMLPLTRDGDALARLAAGLDGLLVTGGPDVNPALYGVPDSGLCHMCPLRDEVEAALLRLFWQENKPILGICRGCQILNVTMGGTLWQDLPTQHPSDVCHRMERPYDRPTHVVTVSGPLAAVLGAVEIGVNSCHHQAIRQSAPGLTAMAVAGDGVVEAVFAPEKRFVWGVQWHPEMMPATDAPSCRIATAFVQAAAGNG